MGLHCPQQQGVLPDEDVPSGSPGEDELLGAPVRHAHHGLQLPHAAERAPAAREASPCNTAQPCSPLARACKATQGLLRLPNNGSPQMGAQGKSSIKASEPRDLERSASGFDSASKQERNAVRNGAKTATAMSGRMVFAHSCFSAEVTTTRRWV